MGAHPNISYDKFPKQGDFAGWSCRVCFNYGDQTVSGVVVRHDYEEPWLTIIRLDDGRHVLATECQYQPLSLAVPEGKA